jgi:O-antigen/teichoic acid export membrane protein
MPIQSLVTTLGAFGMISAMIKYIAEFDGKQDFRTLGKIIVSSSQILIFMAIFYFLLLFMLRDFLSEYLFKDSAFSSLILLCAILISLQIIKIIPRGIFTAFQQMIYITIITIVEQVLRVFFLVVLFYFGFRVGAPYIAWIVAVFIALIIAFLIIKKMDLPVSVGDFKKIDPAVIKMLFMFSIIALGIGFFEANLRSIDTLLLRIITQSNEYVAYYGTASILASLLLIIPTAYGGAIFPYLAKMRGEGKEVKTDLLFGSLLVCIIPIVFCFELFLQEFIQLMFTDRYAASYVPTSILIIGVMFYSLYIVSVSSILTSNNPQSIFIVLSAAFVVDIVANIVLIPIFLTSGAAMASTISYFVCGAGTMLMMKKNNALPDPLIWKVVLVNCIVLIALFAMFNQWNIYIKIVVAAIGIGLSFLLWNKYYPMVIRFYLDFLKIGKIPYLKV